MSSRPAGASSGPRDPGQSVLLVLVVVAVAGLLALGAAQAGATVIDRVRAQNAADAAALAGVDGGSAAAASIALANGATVTSFVRAGPDVEVTVIFHGITAVARATDGP